MLITERELRIIELLKQYCPEWEAKTDDEGYVCTQTCDNRTITVRFIHITRDKTGSFWSRILIYNTEAGEDTIFRGTINISSDIDIMRKLKEWELNRPSDEPTFTDCVIPLIKQFDHALHRQAFEGSYIRLISLVEFVNKLPEQKPPLIEGLVNQGEVIMIYGPSGVGVTTFLMNLAAHTIAGREFLGFAIQHPLKVGYWHFEGSPWEMKAKADKLSRELRGFNENLLYRREYKFKISDADGEATLRNIIEDHELEILIIDNLPNFRGSCNENDASEMTDFVMNPLCNIAGSTGCAIIFAHHTGRETKDKRTGRIIYPIAPRGSTEIEGNCDMTLRYCWDETDANLRSLESHKRRASDKEEIKKTLRINLLTELLQEVEREVGEQEFSLYLSAEEIKAMRLGLELTQKQLAKRIGTSEKSVKNWEAGKATPEDRFRRKLWELQTEKLAEGI